MGAAAGASPLQPCCVAAAAVTASEGARGTGVQVDMCWQLVHVQAQQCGCCRAHLLWGDKKQEAGSKAWSTQQVTGLNPAGLDRRRTALPESAACARAAASCASCSESCGGRARLSLPSGFAHSGGRHAGFAGCCEGGGCGGSFAGFWDGGGCGAVTAAAGVGAAAGFGAFVAADGLSPAGCRAYLSPID